MDEENYKIHKKCGLSWTFDVEWCVVNYNNIIRKKVYQNLQSFDQTKFISEFA